MRETVDQLVLTATDALALRSDPEVVFLDVHLRTPANNCEGVYLSGHVPEAQFVDVGRDLFGAQGPLPDVEALQSAVRRWGVNRSTHVVVYGGDRYPPTARAWWTLKWAGITRVSILDGGLGAWVRGGGSLELGRAASTQGEITLWPGGMPVVGADQLRAIAGNGIVLDARRAEAFYAANEDTRIPGAINAPAALNLDEHGLLLPPEVLRDYYRRLGISANTRVAVYCPAGITSTLTILALESIGIRAALYPGSRVALTEFENNSSTF